MWSHTCLNLTRYVDAFSIQLEEPESSDPPLILLTPSRRACSHAPLLSNTQNVGPHLVIYA